MTDNTYLLLKSLHILGAVLFLGNIIVTGWWKVMADRTRDPVIVAFAQRQVTLTDFVFTAGGAARSWGGVSPTRCYHGMDYLKIRWLAWGLWLFAASGVLWLAVLIPVQVKQAKLAKQFGHGGIIPGEYWSSDASGSSSAPSRPASPGTRLDGLQAGVRRPASKPRGGARRG